MISNCMNYVKIVEMTCSPLHIFTEEWKMYSCLPEASSLITQQHAAMSTIGSSRFSKPHVKRQGQSISSCVPMLIASSHYSLPPFFVCPSNISDDTLEYVASLHRHNRLPVLCSSFSFSLILSWCSHRYGVGVIHTRACH